MKIKRFKEMNEGNMMDMWFGDQKQRQKYIVKTDVPISVETFFKEDVDKFVYLLEKYGIQYRIEKPQNIPNEVITSN